MKENIWGSAESVGFDHIEDFASRLDATAHHLMEPVEWGKSHNRRRGKREMRDIREQRSSQLKNVLEVQKILSSGDLSNVEFLDNGLGRIVGLRVKNP